MLHHGCARTSANGVCGCSGHKLKPSDMAAVVLALVYLFAMVPLTLSQRWLQVCVHERGRGLVTVCINPHMLYVSTPHNSHHLSLPLCKPNLSLLLMRSDPWMLYDVSRFLPSPRTVSPPTLPHFYYSPLSYSLHFIHCFSICYRPALQTIKY